MNRASFTPPSPHTTYTSSSRAFTIVELLIVIVVIAILAAISIIAYRGIQDRANASAASANASQTARKLLAYYAENESYPTSLSQAGIASTTGLQYTYNNTTTPKTYCITATTANKSYYINNTTTTTPTQGGCAGHGVGGVEAITNLARDPEATGSVTGELQPRWNWSRTYVTSAGDAPAGLTSYARITAVSTASGISRGVDHLTNPDNASPANTNQSWPVTANVPITVSVWVRSSVSHPDLRMSFRVHNGAGAWASPLTIAEGQSYAANTWVRVSRTYTPSVTGYLAATTYFYQNTTWNVGTTIDYTGLMVTTGSASGAYADGNSPNWVWNGVPHASTSTGPAL